MFFNRKTPTPAKTVFIVDDEVLLLELEEEFLKHAGYVVRKFTDPEEALREFTKAPPALVLTDYWMPRMSGMDLIRQCRLQNPQQKIVLISGTVDETAFIGAPVQPDKFVAKPFDPNKLLEIVHELIG
jgi:two-component system, OmpR family, response regulator SaeR